MGHTLYNKGSRQEDISSIFLVIKQEAGFL